ncbi:MAG: two-component regulator propeller domain-containing protein [Chitinophagales bacterium]
MPNSKILFLAVLILFSCNDKKENKTVVNESKQYSSVSPQVTLLANLPDSLQPKTILVENTPVPERISIPHKPVDYTIPYQSRSETIHFSPIEKVKAEFSSIMQNYTTEQGLVLDAISCSYADKKGNLWFGTYTGGVSKYDGQFFTNYTTSQGLSSNGINSITEDNKGNLWFGTDNGANIFDGATVSRFRIIKKINSILEDKAGNFWFGTEGYGLYKYAGDSISTYSKSDGLPGNNVYEIKEDKKGIIWIGTENGLCKYDGKAFTNIALSNQEVHTICTDNSGNTWAGTKMGYIKYNGADIITYPADEQIVPFVYEDHFGNICLSSGRGEILYYNGKTFSHINNSNGVIMGEIHSICEDKDGNLWFSSAANGIFSYSGPSFQRLTYNRIRSIFEDKKGDLWFAGYGGLMTRFDGEYFTNYKLNISFWSLFQDKTGNIWMGCEYDGLIKFDGKYFTFYTDLNGLPDNSVKNILQDSEGNLWIGTRNGLSKFDGKTFTTYTIKQGLAGDYISAIAEDKPGDFWIGTDRGLSHFDGKSFTNYRLSHAEGGNYIRSLIKDNDGNIWMGTQGGGLNRYDGKSVLTYTTGQGLPDNVVTQVALTHEGNIVIGTNNGVAILTGYKPVTTTSTNNSNNKADENNYPPQNSLSNADLQNYTPVFEKYNSKTGYPVKDVNRGQHAIFLDSKGMLWIATGSEKSGLMRFDYTSLNKNNTPPELNILAIKVDNEAICWNDLVNTKNNTYKSKLKSDSAVTPASVTEEVTTFGKPLNVAQREDMRAKYKGIEFDAISRFYPVPQNLILPYSHNNITIEFAAIEPAKPSLVQYQYKMEGYDKNWSTPANITSAAFGNIYEGTYQFDVRALSPSGVWSDPIKYSFVVLPPWYRTWWAYLVYVLLFLFALRVFSKWREKNLRNEKEKLGKIVDERTAELKQSFEDLKSTQSQLIQSEKMASLGELTAGIAHEIQNPLNFVNNFSEVNKELLVEMKDEIKKGNMNVVDAIVNDVIDNEEKINHHGKRADAIVKGMLQHSRSGTGQKELVNINAIADECLRLSYHGLRAKDKSFQANLKTDFDESINKFPLMQQEIVRVFINLFNNAFYAVNEKHKQNISGYEPTVLVSTKKVADKVLISVRDNGPGIPQKVLDKIFQPFFTTKPTGQGTGLGLSLSYDIVKAHGGEIKVNTREEEFTEFVVHLPVSV